MGVYPPTSRFFERPWVGVAAAGFANPETEQLMGDFITIDEYLVKHPSRTVLVEVHGESMISLSNISNVVSLVITSNQPIRTFPIYVRRVLWKFMASLLTSSEKHEISHKLAQCDTHISMRMPFMHPVRPPDIHMRDS